MLVTEDRLSAGALNALLAGQALAVRIPGYLEGALCAELTARLLAALDELGGYERIYRSHVPAFTDTAGDGRARDAYFAAASRAMALVRARCRPYASPMDRLRCELDECWPGGAGLLRVAGSPLVFGMLRVWQNGAQALPHLDVLGAPRAAPVARRFTEQLGANVYLSVPRPEPARPPRPGCSARSRRTARSRSGTPGARRGGGWCAATGTRARHSGSRTWWCVPSRVIWC